MSSINLGCILSVKFSSIIQIVFHQSCNRGQQHVDIVVDVATICPVVKNVASRHEVIFSNSYVEFPDSISNSTQSWISQSTVLLAWDKAAVLPQQCWGRLGALYNSVGEGPGLYPTQLAQYVDFSLTV